MKTRTMRRREVCSLLGAVLLPITAARAEGNVNGMMLHIGVDRISLGNGDQVFQFRKEGGVWALEEVDARGVRTVIPVSRQDTFFQGGGAATGFTVEKDTAETKQIAFTLRNATVRYSVRAADRLPLVHVSIVGPDSATVAYRTSAASATSQGAWVTRGETAADAEEKEVFIDASGPVVFGHSRAGNADAAYVFLPEVNSHIQNNGRTEQRTQTYFKSGIAGEGDGRHAFWQLRMTEGEPTRYAVLFDRDLGGRFSRVCEKYYAPVVDTLVDMTALRNEYDPYRALEKMPVRLAAPDAFIPGYGWTMEEYSDAAYPYGHDSSIQTGSLLIYEGLATGREWETNFGKYVLDKTPILGEDGKAFFVRRPGGVTRWGYFSDYKQPFRRLDGGNWNDTEGLYRSARITGDESLKRVALDMMQHDVDVKLDLERMTFAPCWDVINARAGDRRDDWAITALLAYSAELCSEILYPETKDPAYLKKADRIADWFKETLGPEQRMNYLNDGVNLHNCWGGWIPRMLIHRFERSGDRAFLDIAKDICWVQILTLGLTKDADPKGRSFTGVTCTGVRGCIDYDCAPHLCQEKDGVFVNIIGPLLDHADGAGYAKYIELQKYNLPRDRWNDAFGVQELRDVNLRTMYDTYPRAMANLIYALNKTDDPQVTAVEKLVSRAALDISHRRDIVLANATTAERATALHVRFLKPGTYRLTVDGADRGEKTHRQLDAGIPVRMPGNATQAVRVEPLRLDAPLQTATNAKTTADSSATYLSDLTPQEAQRGVGLPQPVYARDEAFGGQPLRFGEKTYRKGIGCAANTVLLYRLNDKFSRFRATVGIDPSVIRKTDPEPSANITIFADGICRFDSGALRANTPPQEVDIPLSGAKTLMIRVSGNWDDGGRTENDHVILADARLTD